MAQMAQPEYPRADDVLKDSSVDQGEQGLSRNSADDHTGGEVESPSDEKKSLISKMKVKAKDKMHKAKDKLKTKLKKDKDAEEGEEDTDDDVEVHPKSLLETPTSGYAPDGSYVNHGKPLNSFGVSQTKAHAYPSTGDEEPQREYDSFLKSTKGEMDGNTHDLTSVPTDYSSPRASVDAIMPPSIISPGSASDLGDQSSTGLGEIPEKPKEEDKVVATENSDKQSRSNPSFGTFGDTTQDKLSYGQKDLQAIERDSMSQELGDGSKGAKFTKKPSGGITEQPREESQRTFAKEADRELPSDEAAVPLREPSKGEEEDSQKFKEKGDLDLPSTEVAVGSRGSGKGSEGPLRDPDVEMPVPQLAELTENMFSSSDADDLRNTENSTGRQESQNSQDSRLPEVSGRDFNHNEASLPLSGSNENFTQKDQVQEGTEPAAEEEFHDPELDESSLEIPTPSSVNTEEIGGETGKFGQNNAEEEKKTGVGFIPSVNSALGSTGRAVGTKVGYLNYPTQERATADTGTSADEVVEPDPAAPQAESGTQGAAEKRGSGVPPITPQNSTVEGLDADVNAPSQSWISKAAGMLFGQSDKEDAVEEGNDEEEDEYSVHPPSAEKGAEKPAVDHTLDSFVQ